MKPIICNHCGKIIKPTEIRETSVDQYGRSTHICSKCADWWAKYANLISFSIISILLVIALLIIIF